MKKILLSMAILAIVFFVGCDKEESMLVTTGSLVEVLTDGLTVLDNQVTFDITTSDPSCTEFTVSGDATGSVAISNGKGSFTVSANNLGVSKVNDKAVLHFTANTPGNPVHTITVTVKNPITLSKLPAVQHQAKVYYHSWSIKTVSASIDAITVEKKVGKNGTYVLQAGPFEAKDSVDISGTDYNVNDTVYVKLTASSGTILSSTVSNIIVAPFAYNKMATFTLDTTTNLAVDLIKGRYVKSTFEFGDSVDMEFTASYTPTGLIIGFESNFNAEFVTTTSSKYKSADVLTTEATSFTGSITANANLKGGEYYIFRTLRGVGAYKYGLIQITKVDKPQGVLVKSYFQIEVKY